MIVKPKGHFIKQLAKLLASYMHYSWCVGEDYHDTFEKCMYRHI